MSAIAGFVSAMLTPGNALDLGEHRAKRPGWNVETELTLVAGGRLIRQRAREPRFARHRDAQRFEPAPEIGCVSRPG